MANRYLTPIQTVTITSGATTNIDFTSIPQGYTDLLIKGSVRDSGSNNSFTLSINSDATTSYTSKELWAESATMTSQTRTRVNFYFDAIDDSTHAANIFNSFSMYIPDYTSSYAKQINADIVSENNSTAKGIRMVYSGKWNNTSAISSLRFSQPQSGFAQYSTITLYGISNYEKIQTNLGGLANGGEVYQDASYWYHVFKQSGTFTPRQAVTADILVIAGGGSGGRTYGGGGGAGGLLCYTSQSLTVSTNYQVTVGSGGVYPASSAAGGDGGNSSFGALTAATGGGGGGYTASGPVSAAGRTGGSGGGGAGGFASTNGASGTAGQGNAGGNGTAAHSASAGGGGAGGAGANSATGGVGGKGGDGVSTFSSWAIATGTGLQNDGLVPSPDYTGTRYFAGGGGGAGTTQTAPSNGSGGFYMGGMANTGQGSSGDSGRNGGSGIVIVRYAK